MFLRLIPLEHNGGMEPAASLRIEVATLPDASVRPAQQQFRLKWFYLACDLHT
jgi:hypothetical protein